jgi:Glycosyl hydrolase family 20, catalytic domain
VSQQVVDAPRFRWRGALLDVGRHFFPVAFLKKFLDVLALHKLNKFHWHLTEDQARRAAEDAELSLAGEHLRLRAVNRAAHAVAHETGVAAGGAGAA